MIEPTKEKLIGEVLKDLCREDLADLGLPDGACKHLIVGLVLAKERKTVASEEVWEAFRQRGKEAKNFSDDKEKLADAEKLNLELQLRNTRHYVDLRVRNKAMNLAASARKKQSEIGKFLRKHARKDDRQGLDQGLVMFLRGFLSDKANFNHWAPLARVIEKVYLVDVGGGPREVDVSAGALQKAAERIRREPPLRRPTPAEVAEVQFILKSGPLTDKGE